MGNLDWNPTDWPDAGGMMDGFLKKGVRTVCITEPFFTSVAATNYNELTHAGSLPMTTFRAWAGSALTR